MWSIQAPYPGRDAMSCCRLESWFLWQVVAACRWCASSLADFGLNGRAFLQIVMSLARLLFLLLLPIFIRCEKLVQCLHFL